MLYIEGHLARPGISLEGLPSNRGILSRVFKNEQVGEGREQHSLTQEPCNRLLINTC